MKKGGKVVSIFKAKVDMIKCWAGHLIDGRPYVAMNLVAFDENGEARDVVLPPVDAYRLGKKLIELSNIKDA